MRKEGLTWLSRRTNQFRYSTNEQDQWVQPLSVYEAGEDILRGHAVSIATPQDVIDFSISTGNVVVKTNTSRHVKVVGIASESVSAGEKVHVQSFGSFQFGGPSAQQTGGVYEEYIPFETELMNVHSWRGWMVYVGPVPGEFTVFRDSAVLGNRNIIQVGLISHVGPTYPQTSLAIEVQFEGDGRGPLGHTQYELQFGEPFNYSLVNGKKPIKVFSIGDTDETQAVYSLIVGRPTVPFNDQGWLAFYNDKGVHFINFRASNTVPQGTTEADTSMIQYLTSLGFPVQAYPLHTGASPDHWHLATLHSDQNTDLYVAPEGEEATGFVAGLKTIIESVVPNVQAFVPHVATDDFGFQSSGTISLQWLEPGPVYVAWDSSLDTMFESSAAQVQGSYDSKGRAVLADPRYGSRAAAIGLLLQDTSKLFAIGDPGLFINHGLYKTSYDAFEAGRRYYLGIDGSITPFTENLIEGAPIIYIGTARDSQTLIVDIQDPRSKQYGESIGTVKPLYKGDAAAHYGYLLMDGASYSKTLYAELYAVLSDMYGEDEVKDITDPEKFLIPSLWNAANSNYYEIKATSYSSDPYIGNCVQKQVQAVVENNTIPDIDITQFLYTGPIGNLEKIDLSRFVIRTFVTTADNKQIELPVGYYKVSTSTYGYQWDVVTTGESTILKMDIGAGKGLAISPNTTSLNGLPIVVKIYKPELFNRYSDFDLDVAKMTLEVVDEEEYPSELPLSSRAVIDYVGKGIVTSSMKVPEVLVSYSDEGDHQATLRVDHGTLVITNGTQTIDPIPQMALHGEPQIVTDNQVVTAQYIENHRKEQISTTYPVHGILQGHANGFDADTVDTLHTGIWKEHGEVASIPVIQVSGETAVGSSISLVATTSSKKIMFTAIDDQTVVLGRPDAPYTSLGIGSEATRYIVNNQGTLELTDRPIPGEHVAATFADIKAASFITASSSTYKENISDFTKSAVNILKAADVKNFTYIGSDVPRIGLIAENAPAELANESRTGIDMSDTLGVLIKAVQELDSRLTLLATLVNYRP